MNIEQIKKIPVLPERERDSHKGSFGKVLITGGSQGMAGAVALAGNAALRSGAGLVRIALPRGIQPTVAALVPCATTIPLPQDAQGTLTLKAANDIIFNMTTNDAIALGPGIAISCQVREVLHNVLNHLENWHGQGMVLDADGLNNLAKLGGIKLNGKVILTPHMGEMKRLWRAYLRQDIPSDRVEQAAILARRTKAVVVLKGPQTVVTDGQKAYINNTGNPGMATGGSGDVLTGIMAALIANRQANLPPIQAAILAVHIHGKAADTAVTSNQLCQTALTAEDIIAYLGQTWQ